MTDAYALLWWLPVGAGGHLVVHTSRWWEVLDARRRHRAPQPLFHAALDVFVGGTRYVVEMTPAWGHRAAFRGVVATGPVGSRRLGRSRLFRYEVRCWPDGVLPDRAEAVGLPVRIALTPTNAQALVGRVATVPRLTWGRDPLGIGDMWNSNSLIAWLLHGAGIDAALLAPPIGGRAPGWATGLAVARAGDEVTCAGSGRTSRGRSRSARGGASGSPSASARGSRPGSAPSRS